MIARALNRAGIERLRTYLARLRAGHTGAPPTALLEDPDHSSELPVEAIVEPRRFVNRFHVGAYLSKALAAVPHTDADRDEGLWSWLSLFWFESLCPRRADGTRRPGADQRHVADFRSRSRYRHLLYGPYLVFRRHNDASRVLLGGPPYVESAIYRDITGVQDLIANRGVLEAAALLYLEPDGSRLKRGCQPSQPRPGTVRRLVRVLQQLDLTHDVYGMSGEEIVQVLPPEFDAWRSTTAPHREPAG